MTNFATNWVLRRQKFCCCLPVRFGVIVMSSLGVLLAGLLAVILWFEVKTNQTLSSREHIGFIVAALVETVLFLASILGYGRHNYTRDELLMARNSLIGASARKQLFLNIYAGILYIHFVLNLGVAIYLLWEVTHTANNDIAKACQIIQNAQTKTQCTGLLRIAKGVYWTVALLVLVIEAYGALIVTRYANQLRTEKKGVRESRMLKRQSAYEAYHKRLSTAGTGDSDDRGLLMKDFNPYEDKASPYTPGLLPDVEASPGAAMAPRVESEAGVEPPSASASASKRLSHDTSYTDRSRSRESGPWNVNIESPSPTNSTPSHHHF